MGRIITDWHCDRLEELIKNSGGEVVLGGEVDKTKNYVAPTVIVNPKEDSKLLTEEIFGPIVPVKTFKHINEVIDTINLGDKPLAIYYFGSRYLNNNLHRV
jgi:aldehyde dehydrogenase (NAD+)